MAPAEASAPWKRVALYAAGVIALLLAGLAGNFLPAILESSSPTATPVVTSYATATPIESLVEIPLQPTPVVVATSTPRVFPTATRVVVAPTSTPVRTPVPAAGSAYLTVNARPWVQVYVDGRLVTAETPLRRYKLTAGRHTLRFANPTTKFVVERSIELPADVERNIFVDVKTGAVTIK